MDFASLEPGHLIANRYRIVRRLGMGGMGAVYEAEHVQLGKPVAVKVLLPQLSRSGDMTARFMREARSAAQIGHPGIVQVFDLGADNEAPFLVMEKLEGEELGSRIERSHPLPVQWVVKMGIELCDALQAAHEHGIVHRDLKPPNVFLAKQGRNQDVVKVLDFGIAKLTQGTDDIQTRTGQVFGTPMYMAPEQLRDSKDVDCRADIYGIACILYQALAGKPPFDASTYPDLVFRICSAPRPRALDIRGDVSRALSAVIERAMALRVEDRFATAAELATALGAPDQHSSMPVVSTQLLGASVAPPVAGRSSSEQAASAAALTPHSQTTPPKSRSRLGALTSAVVAFALVGGAGAALALRGGAAPPPEPSAQPSAAPVTHSEPAAVAAAAPQAAPAPAARSAVGSEPAPATSAAPATARPAASAEKPLGSAGRARPAVAAVPPAPKGAATPAVATPPPLVAP